MDKKWLLLFIVLFAVSAVAYNTVIESGGLGGGTTINQFNDSTTSKNINFSTNENNTYYVAINKDLTITTAQVTLTSNRYSRNNTSKEWTYTANGISQNYGDLWFNYTLPTNTSDVIWEVYFNNSGYNYTLPLTCRETKKVALRVNVTHLCYPSECMTVRCLQESTDTWIALGGETTDSGGGGFQGGTDTPNQVNDNNYASNNGCMWREGGFGWYCGGGRIGSRFHEERIYYQSNVSNPYLEVGTADGSREWEHSGSLEGTNTTSDFSSVINNYLSGCTEDASGNCHIPFLFHSDEIGVLKVTNLNILSKIKYNFTYENDTIFNVPNTYTLIVFNNSSTATFYYNNTAYTPTSVVGSNNVTFTRTLTPNDVTSSIGINYTIPMYWEVNDSSELGNTSEYNQTVYKPAIDNCSGYPTRWINYTLRDELTNSILTGNITYIFNYRYGGTSVGQYNNTGTGQSSFEMCMYPAWTNFTTDVTLQYSIDGYESRDYVKENYAVNNTTEQVNLYALSSGQSTAITIHVIDGDDQDIEGVFVEAYRYDLDTDSELLVESETTDSDGNVILNLQAGSTYYVFKFYINGELRLSTNRFKLFSTSYEYVITDEVTTRLGEWLILNRDVDRNLNYTNTTNLVYFDWSYGGSLADQFCLSISLTNGTSYYYSCSTNMTGSFEYTITALNQTYVALGQVITTSGFTFNLETLNIDTREFGHTLGTDFSLMISFIVFLVIAMLGLINASMAIIMSVFALIILSLFGILPISGWLTTLVIFGLVILIIINRRRTI